MNGAPVVTARHGVRNRRAIHVAINRDMDADPGLRSGQALRRHDGEGHRAEPLGSTLHLYLAPTLQKTQSQSSGFHWDGWVEHGHGGVNPSYRRQGLLFR